MTPSSLLLPLYYVSFEMFCRVNNARPTSSRGGGDSKQKRKDDAAGSLRLANSTKFRKFWQRNFGKAILVDTDFLWVQF